MHDNKKTKYKDSPKVVHVWSFGSWDDDKQINFLNSWNQTVVLVSHSFWKLTATGGTADDRLMTGANVHVRFPLKNRVTFNDDDDEPEKKEKKSWVSVFVCLLSRADFRFLLSACRMSWVFFSWLVAAATRLDELWQSVERHAAAEKSKILNEQHRTRPPPPPQ